MLSCKSWMRDAIFHFRKVLIWIDFKQRLSKIALLSKVIHFPVELLAIFCLWMSAPMSLPFLLRSSLLSRRTEHVVESSFCSRQPKLEMVLSCSLFRILFVVNLSAHCSAEYGIDDKENTGSGLPSFPILISLSIILLPKDLAHDCNQKQMESFRVCHWCSNQHSLICLFLWFCFLMLWFHLSPYVLFLQVIVWFFLLSFPTSWVAFFPFVSNSSLIFLPVQSFCAQPPENSCLITDPGYGPDRVKVQLSMLVQLRLLQKPLGRILDSSLLGPIHSALLSTSPSPHLPVQIDMERCSLDGNRLDLIPLLTWFCVLIDGINNL